MCLFGGNDQPVVQEVIPEAPAEVLKQEAPEKKTKNKVKDPLKIGTKKYTTSPSATATAGYPSVSQ